MTAQRHPTISAAYLVIVTLGLCFTFLIMGLEGAVGGAVSPATELGPALLAFLAVAAHATNAPEYTPVDDVDGELTTDSHNR